MYAEQRFLDHVLGLGDAAEHPVRDPERDRPQLVEQFLAIGHAVTNPFRQFRCAAPRPAICLTARRAPGRHQPASHRPAVLGTTTLISGSSIEGYLHPIRQDSSPSCDTEPGGSPVDT